jgi:putative ABC transport system permease protein
VSFAKTGAGDGTVVVDLAFKILLHDKLRFLMTVVGVMFADVLVLVQVGLFLGLLENASSTIDRLDADLWVMARNTKNIEFAQAFPEDYTQRVRSIPGVERADNMIVMYGHLRLPSGTRDNVLIYALEDFAKWRFPAAIVEGALPDLRHGSALFLDDSATRRFGDFQVGEHRDVLGKRFKIAGRTADAQSFTSTPIAFMPYRCAQAVLFAARPRTSYIIARLAAGTSVEAVRAEIRRKLPQNDVFTKAEWAQSCRSYWIEKTGIGLNIFLTIFLGCLVGVVVVAQTLYAATMEHLEEFGTIKAIGGTNADIYAILAKQSCIAAFVGFFLSLAPVFGLRHLALLAGLKIQITTELGIGVLAGTVLLCIGAGAISFKKIANIDPALVFRG